MNMRRVVRGDALGMLCIGLAGGILATAINNDLLTAEIVILIAFLINVIAISGGAMAKIKDRLRYFSASLLLGTFIGVVLA
jgi:MFS-type transporter involved in bile tolerance (Atg22 family)